jgi:hypothetical protein
MREENMKKNLKHILKLGFNKPISKLTKAQIMFFNLCFLAFFKIEEKMVLILLANLKKLKFFKNLPIRGLVVTMREENMKIKIFKHALKLGLHKPIKNLIVGLMMLLKLI